MSATADGRPVALPSIDHGALARDGFVAVPGFVDSADLAAFEHAIRVAGERLAESRGIVCEDAEPLTAVIRAAGAHRSLLFDHVKRLWVLERLTSEIGCWLEEQGFFVRCGIAVPLFWPTLRADLPGETIYSFPLHQDYATTRSHKAWRLWIPLRDTDEHHGTMKVAVGSHRGGPYEYVTENTPYPHLSDDEIERQGFEVRTLELPAGSLVLFDPLLVHGSVPNKSDRTKYVLLLHLQDLAEFVNPDDRTESLAQFLDLTRIKTEAEKKHRR